MQDNHYKSETTVFLKTAIITGLLLVFLTPPMCTPDENAHYLNEYGVSRGDFFPIIVGNMPGRYVEARVLDFVTNSNGKYSEILGAKYSFADQYFDSYLPNENTEFVFYANSLNSINPVAYMPAGAFMALGRFIASAVHSPLVDLPYNLLLFARLGNLLFYITVIYLAMQRAPSYRRLILVLAMMPMSIFLGASVNYDAVLIPVSILFVAEVCKLLHEGAEVLITKDDLFVVLFCVFFLVGVKQAYATLLLLLIAVPRKKYGGDKRMILCVAAVFATGILAYSPSLYLAHIIKDTVNINEEILAEQAVYIHNNIEKIPGLILHTLKMYGTFYLSGFYGELGQLDTNFPVVFEVLFYAILLYVTISECMFISIWDARWKRLLPVLAVGCSIYGMFFIIYKTWTPLPGVAEGVGSSYISGVQGRYFIELYFPLACLLSCSRFSKARILQMMANTSGSVAKMCAVICGISTPLLIFVRYW